MLFLAVFIAMLIILWWFAPTLEYFCIGKDNWLAAMLVVVAGWGIFRYRVRKINRANDLQDGAG